MLPSLTNKYFSNAAFSSLCSRVPAGVNLHTLSLLSLSAETSQSSSLQCVCVCEWKLTVSCIYFSQLKALPGVTLWELFLRIGWSEVEPARRPSADSTSAAPPERRSQNNVGGVLSFAAPQKDERKESKRACQGDASADGNGINGDKGGKFGACVIILPEVPSTQRVRIPNMAPDTSPLSLSTFNHVSISSSLWLSGRRDFPPHPLPSGDTQPCPC